LCKIEPLGFSIALFVVAGLASFSVVQARTAAPQRGVQDITAPASSAPAPVGPYYALVIGNNNYQHLPKLQTAVNDAKDVALLLRDGFGFQTKVLYDATRSQIIEAIDSYRALPEKSNLVIYYAGHGWNDKDADRAYWLPVDAEAHQRPNWINSTDITDGIHAIRSRHILVISDSCLSGDLTKRRVGGGITSEDLNAKLASALKLKSRHIMSSGGDEPVADVGANEHSVFANALLESLRDMEGDAFTGETLLHQRVEPRVVRRSRQNPQYLLLRESDADLGDFVFFRSKNTQAGKALAVSAKTILIDAKRYYEAKQYDRALPLFRSAAKDGNGEAARCMGDMYANGLGGLPKDDAQAVSWYRKAAEAGDAAGMVSLAQAYGFGRGLARDDVQAVMWFRKAADAGDAVAMGFLGYAYANGAGGLAKDDAEAVMWYRKAVDAGNAGNMVDLGNMFASGRGLARDDVQAVMWYRKAADAGVTDGMNNLGNMYASGQGGLAKDDARAVSWYHKAADAGNTTGMINLGRMYESGRGGLRKDKTQAVFWYRKAAALGRDEAKQELKRLGH